MEYEEGEDNGEQAAHIIDSASEITPEIQEKALKETQASISKRVFKHWKKVEYVNEALANWMTTLGDKDERLLTAWATTEDARNFVASNTMVNGLYCSLKTDGSGLDRKGTVEQMQVQITKINGRAPPKVQLLFDAALNAKTTTQDDSTQQAKSKKAKAKHE